MDILSFARANAAIPRLKASSFAATKRISLWSGGAYKLPAGWITLYNFGPFLDLMRWDQMRQCWSVIKKPASGLFPPFWSDGVSWRVVNTVNCCIYALLKNSGSGYSAGNPPVVTVNSANFNGRVPAQLRCIVGGAISGTIVSGGVYDYTPSIEFDYSGQTGPIRPAQINVQINNSTGAIAGFTYDGNDNADWLGASNTWSGAGIDASKLTFKIVRHPDDTQTSNAVLTFAANSTAADKVNAVDVMKFGTARGDNDPSSGFAITHNGGTGLNLQLLHNHYVTGYKIVDGGSYYFTDLGSGSPFKSYLNGSFTGSIAGTTLTVTAMLGSDPLLRGTKLNTATGVAANTYVGVQLSGTPGGVGTYQVSVSQTKASGTIYFDRYDYPPLIPNASADDEESRPMWQPPITIFGGAGGAVTAVNGQGLGPGWQFVPFLSLMTPTGATCVRPATIVATTGSGGDYFTFEVQ